MPNDPRIEAAAKAHYQSDPYPEKWKMAQPAMREFHRARMVDALAAADAVMFSEEAIERASMALHAHNSWLGWNDISELAKAQYRLQARAVVAALRDGAE